MEQEPLQSSSSVIAELPDQSPGDFLEASALPGSVANSSAAVLSQSSVVEEEASFSHSRTFSVNFGSKAVAGHSVRNGAEVQEETARRNLQDRDDSSVAQDPASVSGELFGEETRDDLVPNDMPLDSGEKAAALDDTSLSTQHASLQAEPAPYQTPEPQDYRQDGTAGLLTHYHDSTKEDDDFAEELLLLGTEAEPGDDGLPEEDVVLAGTTTVDDGAPQCRSQIHGDNIHDEAASAPFSKPLAGVSSEKSDRAPVLTQQSEPKIDSPTRERPGTAPHSESHSASAAVTASTRLTAKRRKTHRRVLDHTASLSRSSALPIYRFSGCLPATQQACCVACCERYCFIATMSMNSSVQVWEYDDSLPMEPRGVPNSIGGDESGREAWRGHRGCRLTGPIGSLQLMSGMVTCLRVSADAERLLVCTVSGFLYVWDVSVDKMEELKAQTKRASEAMALVSAATASARGGGTALHQLYGGGRSLESVLHGDGEAGRLAAAAEQPFIPEEEAFRPLWTYESHMSCDVLKADFLQDSRTVIGVGKRPAGHLTFYHRDTGRPTAWFSGFTIICREPSAPPLPLDLSRCKVGRSSGTTTARMHDLTCVVVDRQAPPRCRGRRDGQWARLSIEGRWVAVGDANGNVGVFFVADEWLASLYSAEGDQEMEVRIGQTGRSGNWDVALAACQLCERTVGVEDVAWRWRRTAEDEEQLFFQDDDCHIDPHFSGGVYATPLANLAIIAACADGYIRYCPIEATLSSHFAFPQFASEAALQPRYDVRGSKPRRIYSRVLFNTAKVRLLRCCPANSISAVRCICTQLLELASDDAARRHAEGRRKVPKTSRGGEHHPLDDDDVDVEANGGATVPYMKENEEVVGTVLFGCNSMRYSEAGVYSRFSSEADGGAGGEFGTKEVVESLNSANSATTTALTGTGTDSRHKSGAQSLFSVRVIEYKDFSNPTYPDTAAGTPEAEAQVTIGGHDDCVVSLAVCRKYAVSAGIDGAVKLFELARALPEDLQLHGEEPDEPLPAV